MDKALTPNQIKVLESILEHFKWSGAMMIFPGERGNAVIRLEDLIKIIQWTTN